MNFKDINWNIVEAKGSIAFPLGVGGGGTHISSPEPISIQEIKDELSIKGYKDKKINIISKGYELFK
ncbi:MAG: hypothetical protein KKG76_09735 [Euryarchaeota archaeon]|nr:hypothetical protein [Euryarchaeota archaeon]